jgi:hypothetical protein
MPLFAPPKLTETYTTTFFLPSSSTEAYVSPISNLLLTDGNGGTYFTTFPTALIVSTIYSLESISTTSTFTDFLSVRDQTVDSINVSRQIRFSSNVLLTNSNFRIGQGSNITFINTMEIQTSNIFLNGFLESPIVSLVDNSIAYDLYVESNALYFDGNPVGININSGGFITLVLSNVLTSTISVTDTMTVGELNPVSLYTMNDGIHLDYNITSALITSTIKTQDILLSNYIPDYSQPFIVAVGSDRVPANQIQSSTDGSNWSPSIVSFEPGSYPTSVAYNGSLWVATVTNGITSLLYSTDAKEWDNAIGGFNLLVNGVSWRNNQWLAFGLDDSGNSILKSTDGSNWSSSVRSGGFIAGANSGAWNGSLWVAVGTGTTATNSIQSSTDGSNWSSALSGGFSGSGRCIAWNGSYWLAGGYDAYDEKTIQKSTDGRRWSPSLNAHLTQVNCLAWNGSNWISGGELTNGITLESSPDGLIWTPIDEIFPGDCYGITWIPSFWVATGGDTLKKTIKTSTDGLTWNPIINGGFSSQGYAITSTSNVIPSLTYFTEISPSYITTSNILTNTVTLIDASVESMVLSSQEGTLYYGASPVFTNNGSVSYINTVAQSIPSHIYTAVNWTTIDIRQTYGVTNIAKVGTNFSNLSMNVLCLSVSGYIGWDIGGKAGSSRNVLAFLNGTVADMNSCLSYSSIPTPSSVVGELNPVVNFSFNTILNPSDYFEIYVYHNDLTAQEINTQIAFPGSRITIFVK